MSTNKIETKKESNKPEYKTKSLWDKLMEAPSSGIYFGFSTLCVAAVLVFMMIFFTGCSLISTKDYKLINTDAKKVAEHNLSMLRYCNSNNTNYLWTKSNKSTSQKNLFLYLNDITEDLQKSKVCFARLTEYNKNIVEQIKEGH